MDLIGFFAKKYDHFSIKSKRQVSIFNTNIGLNVFFIRPNSCAKYNIPNRQRRTIVAHFIATMMKTMLGWAYDYPFKPPQTPVSTDLSPIVTKLY